MSGTSGEGNGVAAGTSGTFRSTFGGAASCARKIGVITQSSRMTAHVNVAINVLLLTLTFMLILMPFSIFDHEQEHEHEYEKETELVGARGFEPPTSWSQTTR